MTDQLMQFPSVAKPLFIGEFGSNLNLQMFIILDDYKTNEVQIGRSKIR